MSLSVMKGFTNKPNLVLNWGWKSLATPQDDVPATFHCGYDKMFFYDSANIFDKIQKILWDCIISVVKI